MRSRFCGEIVYIVGTIVGIEAQVAKARRGLSGLRELYEQARKRGAAGTNTVAEVFFSDEFEEVSK